MQTLQLSIPEWQVIGHGQQEQLLALQTAQPYLQRAIQGITTQPMHRQQLMLEGKQ